MLRQADGLCHWCGKDGADQVNHLVAGDDHSYENLAPIHRHPCHAEKGSAEGTAAWRERAAQQYRRKNSIPA